jgi:hypothetical protein
MEQMEKQYLNNLEQKAFDMACIIGRYQSLLEASIEVMKGDRSIGVDYFEKKVLEQKGDFNKVIGIN